MPEPVLFLALPQALLLNGWDGAPLITLNGGTAFNYTFSLANGHTLTLTISVNVTSTPTPEGSTAFVGAAIGALVTIETLRKRRKQKQLRAAR